MTKRDDTYVLSHHFAPIRIGQTILTQPGTTAQLPLEQWIFRSSALTSFNPKTFGAQGDGVTDDTAAVLQAIGAVLAQPRGGTLFFEPGRYMLSQTLSVTLSGIQSFAIEGAGDTLSELIWTADVDGVVVNITSNAYWLRNGANPGPTVQRKNITFARQQAATGKTAFTVQGVGAIGSAGLLQVVAEGIVDRGDISGGGGWLVGCLYARTAQTSTQRYYCHGGADGIAAGAVGVKITTTSDFISVDHHLSNCRMADGTFLLDVGDYVQGVGLHNYSCVNAQVARWLGVTGHGCDLLRVHDGHCSMPTGLPAIVVYNVNAVSVQGNYFISAGVGATVRLNNVSGAVVAGNRLLGPTVLSSTGVQVINDTSIAATDASVIVQGNNISNYDVACAFSDHVSNGAFCNNVIGFTNVTVTDTSANPERNQKTWNKHYSGLTYGPDRSGQTSYYFDDGNTYLGANAGANVIFTARGSFTQGYNVVGAVTHTNTSEQYNANSVFTHQYQTVAGATVPQVQVVFSGGTAGAINSGDMAVAGSVHVLGPLFAPNASVSGNLYLGAANNASFTWDAALSRVVLLAGTVRLASWDTAGNMRLSGAVVAGAP